MDPARQLQRPLQEEANPLRVQDVAEHPDLRPLPLDVGVAGGEGGASDGAADGAPRLEGDGTDSKNIPEAETAGRGRHVVKTKTITEINSDLYYDENNTKAHYF